MPNALVKPNSIIEQQPRNMLVSRHSQGNVSKITFKLQPYMIICFFVRQLFVLKIFQFLLKVLNMLLVLNMSGFLLCFYF